MNKNLFMKNPSNCQHASMKTGVMASKPSPHAGNLICQHESIRWRGVTCIRVITKLHAGMLACWQIFKKNVFLIGGGIYRKPEHFYWGLTVTFNCGNIEIVTFNSILSNRRKQNDNCKINYRRI